jgi:hypothetical protein
MSSIPLFSDLLGFWGNNLNTLGNFANTGLQVVGNVANTGLQVAGGAVGGLADTAGAVSSQVPQAIDNSGEIQLLLGELRQQQMQNQLQAVQLQRSSGMSNQTMLIIGGIALFGVVAVMTTRR